jgi:glycosyltransferase involved in cell wall biosynthesis
MNVLYDISMLGLEYENGFKPTGISRVVENVAGQLIRHPETSVKFCSGTSFENIAGCIEYINRNPVYSKIKFSLPLRYKFQLSDLQQQKNIYKVLETSTSEKQLKTISSKMVLRYLSLKSKLYQRFPTNQHIRLSDLQNADIYHSPFFGIPQSVKHSKPKSVFITSYDILPILYPAYFWDGAQAWFQNILDTLDQETWVLCISNSTRNDLLNYMGAKLNPDRVIVTPLAASDSFYQSTDHILNKQVKMKYGIENKPYFLSVCTLEPRKNIESVVRSFANLIQQEKLADVNLVLVGGKGWLFDKIFDEIKNPEVKKRVIVTGFVPDEDLAPLYTEALAFVYPSFYEGFGLPPLESMKCGTPVITSNTSSLPEVVGTAAITIDPSDTSALSEAMLQLYENDALRKTMSVASLVQAKKFSWKSCAELTVKAYKQSLSI